jgi:hypothetical protein
MTNVMKSESIIRVQYLPTFAHYLRFMRYSATRQTRRLRPFGIIAVVCFLLVPLLPFDGNPSALAKYRTCLGALILPGALFVLLPLTAYFSASKRWNTAAELRESKTYEFSDTGLSVTADTYKGFTHWNNIVRAESTGPLFLLYTAQSAAYLIPVDSFGASERVDAFKALVRKNVPDHKRL